jgi:hypothetical protein
MEKSYIVLTKHESRQNIINNFHKNILGKRPEDINLKLTHEGSLGHWIESNLGGTIDADVNADLNGYECKIQSKKTSWGDWGAPYRIFCDKQYKLFNKKNVYENMWILVKAIGVKRTRERNETYYSMSGKDVPQYINDLTSIGLTLKEKNGDIMYVYNFFQDERESKKMIPKELQKDELIIMKWYGTNKSLNNFKEKVITNNLPIDIKWEGNNACMSLEERVRKKFGVYGIVIVLHDNSKGFYGLKFLKKISFTDWMNFFRNKDIIYDTALTTRNKRPYNQWRSSSKFMKSLEEENYIP